jgi:hypothetical protein
MIWPAIRRNRVTGGREKINLSFTTDSVTAARGLVKIMNSLDYVYSYELCNGDVRVQTSFDFSSKRRPILFVDSGHKPANLNAKSLKIKEI